jgi:hypothetical protein
VKVNKINPFPKSSFSPFAKSHFFFPFLVIIPFLFPQFILFYSFSVLSAQPASVLPNPNAALLAAMSPALIATSTAQNAAAAYKTQVHPNFYYFQ